MTQGRDQNLFIGLMCGTSADGIDAALVQWDQSGKLHLVETQEHPLPLDLRQSLLALNNHPNITPRKLSLLDTQVAEAHAEAVKALLAKTKTISAQVCAIGFHGQTIDHAPAAPIKNTSQIGNAHLLTAITGIPVIADVRRADIAVGGQGAPLAPALHAELLRESVRDVAVVNIGGIANLSLLPADDQQSVLGFDTGPGNCLMDEWIDRSLGQRYDNDGGFAKSGTANEQLLETLLSSAYFQRKIPKSTGRDLFNADWLEANLLGENCRPEDTQATLALLTARTIANDINRYLPNAAQLYVCGGGARNKHLMALLEQEMPKIKVCTTAARGIDPDWMEAILMAWLARQYYLNKAGNLPSVTGASYSVRLGVSYMPPQTILD